MHSFLLHSVWWALFIHSLWLKDLIHTLSDSKQVTCGSLSCTLSYSWWDSSLNMCRRIWKVPFASTMSNYVAWKIYRLRRAHMHLVLPLCGLPHSLPIRRKWAESLKWTGAKTSWLRTESGCSMRTCLFFVFRSTLINPTVSICGETNQCECRLSLTHHVRTRYRPVNSLCWEEFTFRWVCLRTHLLPLAVSRSLSFSQKACVSCPEWTCCSPSLSGSLW